MLGVEQEKRHSQHPRKRCDADPAQLRHQILAVHCEDGDAEQPGRECRADAAVEQESDEELVIIPADAVVDEGAVVVKFVDAAAANAAVVRVVGLIQVAGVAVSNTTPTICLGYDVWIF